MTVVVLPQHMRHKSLMCTLLHTCLQSTWQKALFKYITFNLVIRLVPLVAEPEMLLFVSP